MSPSSLVLVLLLCLILPSLIALYKLHKLKQRLHELQQRLITVSGDLEKEMGTLHESKQRLITLTSDLEKKTSTLLNPDKLKRKVRNRNDKIKGESDVS